MRLLKRYGIGSLAVIVILIVGFLFRYDIHDWIKLRGYSPEPSVVALADATTMRPDSRRLFYVNRPVIADRETFNDVCRENEYSIVLGCYLPGQRGIYLLDVTDERLKGIKEVTAVHELLHAVYERLSTSERRRVDSLLQIAFEDTTDTRIRETIELYRKQDPSIVTNEMHSIFGSEVRSLSPELEAHYSKYFLDRLAIVRLAEQYEQAFTERRNQIRQLDAELTALKGDIDSGSAELNQKDSELKSLRAQMNTYQSEGNNEAYNELVPVYNANVTSFNALIDEVRALIVRYNAVVQQRNEIASEEAELVQAIDSREVLPEDR